MQTRESVSVTVVRLLRCRRGTLNGDTRCQTDPMCVSRESLARRAALARPGGARITSGSEPPSGDNRPPPWEPPTSRCRCRPPGPARARAMRERSRSRNSDLLFLHHSPFTMCPTVPNVHCTALRLASVSQVHNVAAVPVARRPTVQLPNPLRRWCTARPCYQHSYCLEAKSS